MAIILSILSDQPISNVAFIKEKANIGYKYIFIASKRTVACGMIDNIKSTCKIVYLENIIIDANKAQLIHRDLQSFDWVRTAQYVTDVFSLADFNTERDSFKVIIN